MGPTGVVAGPTGVVVHAWVLQGLCDRGCVTCMGPTGVVVRAWVVQGLWCMCDVHGSYRSCVTCMGPKGVV